MGRHPAAKKPIRGSIGAIALALIFVIVVQARARHRNAVRA